MDTMSYIIGRNSAGGGGTGITPSWSDVTDKPFNTVGEGLEVSSGALKEAVPVYTEQVSGQVTDNSSFIPNREYTATYTNEFYAEVGSYIVDTISNDYSGSCTLYFQYWVGNDAESCTATVQNIYNDGTETFTDSASKSWHFYFTYDNTFHLTCLDSYDGYDLMVAIEEPGLEEALWGNFPARGEVRSYVDKFSCPITDSWLANFFSSTTNSFRFSWYEGEGYSQSQWSVELTDWDYTDGTTVYTDNGGYHWKVYMEEDGENTWYFHADCQDTLPVGTNAEAYVDLEFTYTGTTEVVHQLPAQYVPIDENTILVNESGKLEANLSSVQPAWNTIIDKPFQYIGEGLEVSDGYLKECIPVYRESGETQHSTEVYSYTLDKYNSGTSGYQVPLDYDWRILQQYDAPQIDFRWKLEDQTEYRLNTPFYLFDPDGIYQDDGGYNWKIQVNGNANAYLTLECQDTLPADAESTAEGTVTVFVEQVDYIYHKLPADYIQVDNSTIVNDDGYLTANIPAIPVISATATLATGTQIGEIEIDGATTTLYAPTPTVVGITNTLSTGTAIGDLEIDGITTTLYAPASSGADVPVEWGNSSKNSAILMNSNFMVSATGQNSVVLVSGQVYGQSGIALNAGTVSGLNGLAWGRNSSVQQSASNGMALGDGVLVNGSYSKGIGRDIQMNANVGDRIYIGDGLIDSVNATAPKFMRGQYNNIAYGVTYPTYVDLVGNGTADNARSNAEATDMSGNKYLAGDIYVNVTDWANPTTNSIKLANIPAAPTTTAATLTLQATIDGSGNVTYSWV